MFSSLPLVTDQIKSSFFKRYPSFQCHYYRQHVIGFPAVQVVSNPNTPKHVEVTRRWENRDRNGLWWHVLCSQTAHPKGVVRSWFCRRVRNAFREELRMRNMDKNCRPTECRTHTEAPALITGYLRLQISSNLTEVKYSQIRQDCGRTIDELLVRSRPQPPGPKSPRAAHPTIPVGKPLGRHLAPQMRALHESARANCYHH